MPRKRMTWDDYPEPVRDPASGCLRWQGTHHSQGYGLIGGGQLCQYAHRVAWERGVGPIPDGLHVDHVKARGCIYRDCVAIEHLEPVSQAENNRRIDHIQGQMARTHCPKEHPYEGHNLIVRRGKRECRTCVYDRNREARKARRARARIDK